MCFNDFQKNKNKNKNSSYFFFLVTLFLSLNDILTMLSIYRTLIKYR